MLNRSSVLKIFLNKRINLTSPTNEMRTNLAILHWNENVDCSYTSMNTDTNKMAEGQPNCRKNYDSSSKSMESILSRDARKPVFGISDQVRHKPGCTSSEAG